MLRDRSPLSWHPKAPTPLDLHFLGTPLAFVLSQDQTLRTKPKAQAPEDNPRVPALPFQKVHTLDPIPQCTSASPGAPLQACPVFKEPAAQRLRHAPLPEAQQVYYHTTTQQCQASSPVFQHKTPARRQGNRMRKEDASLVTVRHRRATFGCSGPYQFHILPLEGRCLDKLALPSALTDRGNREAISPREPVDIIHERPLQIHDEGSR